MSAVYKKLAQGILGTTPAAIYTAPTSKETIIKKITLANVSGSDCWAKLYDGGSGDGNVILPGITIEAGGFGEWTGGALTVYGGNSLYGVAENASAIVYTIYGTEKD